MLCRSGHHGRCYFLHYVPSWLPVPYSRHRDPLPSRHLLCGRSYLLFAVPRWLLLPLDKRLSHCVPCWYLLPWGSDYGLHRMLRWERLR